MWSDQPSAQSKLSSWCANALLSILPDALCRTGSPLWLVDTWSLPSLFYPKEFFFFFFVIHGSSFFSAEESTHTNVLISTQLKNWYLWKAFSGLFSSLCALLCKFLPLWDPRFCFFSSGDCEALLGSSPSASTWKELPLGSVQEINLHFPRLRDFCFVLLHSELNWCLWFEKVFISQTCFSALSCTRPCAAFKTSWLKVTLSLLPLSNWY